KSEPWEAPRHPGTAVRVTAHPEAAARHAEQQQPDGPGHVVAFGGDALSLQVNCFVQAGDETGGDRRWSLCRSCDGFRPHTVLKLSTAFARCCELIGKLRLAMRLDAKWHVFHKHLHNIARVRFG